MSPTETTLILSVMQSVTEFLPVSSSGHLILLDSFGITNQDLLMDISLHLGTLFAVCAFFYKDILNMLTGFWHKGVQQKIVFSLIIATIPAGLAGFFLNDIIETVLRSPMIIAFTSIFYGILLWVVDKYAPKTKTVEQITYRHAFCIGLAQALALVPGTSRSGITMTCARFLGYKRVESARFSMLMSIPVIALGGIYMLWQGAQEGALSAEMIHQLTIGIASSALFGLLAVWFLMRWLKKASFGIFAVYRVALGFFLLFWLWQSNQFEFFGMF